MKILIVDDSKTILKMSANLVKTIIPDAEIILFDTPLKAVEMMSSGVHVDVAFLDYNMEGMNGLELAQAILQVNPAPIMNGNICIVSANTQEVVKKRANELGLEFIEKPFDEAKLKSFLSLKGFSYGT